MTSRAQDIPPRQGSLEPRATAHALRTDRPGVESDSPRTELERLRRAFLEILRRKSGAIGREVHGHLRRRQSARHVPWRKCTLRRSYLSPAALLEGGRRSSCTRPQLERTTTTTTTTTTTCHIGLAAMLASVRYVVLLRFDECEPSLNSTNVLQWPQRDGPAGIYDEFKDYLANGLNVTYSEPYRDSGLDEWGNGLTWLCKTAGIKVLLGMWAK